MNNRLAEADTTWIESITLDGEEHEVTVTLNVPMGTTAGTAAYEEVIDFDSPTTPEYLHRATREFAEAAVRFVRERGAAAVPEGAEVRCTTCTGACCARVYSEVAVSPEDVARMGGVDSPTVKRGVVLYPHGTSFTGYAGMLKRTSWQGEGEAMWEGDDKPMACVFLDTRTALCTIYDIRPQICREYTAHDCDEHEQGSQKLITLRRKSMKPAPAGVASSAGGKA